MCVWLKKFKSNSVEIDQTRKHKLVRSDQGVEPKQGRKGTLELDQLRNRLPKLKYVTWTTLVVSTK